MRKNLLKSMLVALMAMVGTTAWADDIYTQNYDDATDAASLGWTTKTSGRFNPVIMSDVVADPENEGQTITVGTPYVSVEQGTRNNNGSEVYSTEFQGKVEAGTDFAFIFDLRISNSNNQEPVSLTFNDAANAQPFFSLTATGKNVETWKINGTSDPITLPGTNKGGNDISTCTWYTVKVCRSGALTYVTITDKAEGTEIVKDLLVETKSEAGGLGKMTFVTRRYNANLAMDNVVIRDLEDGDIPVAIPTTWTLKYVDEAGVTLKDDVTIETIAGVSVSANAEQLAAIFVDGTKYIYKEGNDAITTVEDATQNVITLVYRVAETWTYTINATFDGAILKPIAEGSTYENESVTIIAPAWLMTESGQLVTGGMSSDKKYYTNSFTVNSNDFKGSIDYTASSFENVVFFSEAEDIETLEPIVSGYLDTRFSNGKGAYAKDEAKTITTLSAGKYKITAQAMGTMSACKFTMRAGSVPVWTTTTNSNSFYINANGGVAGYVFELTGETEISLDPAGGDGSNSRVTNCIDYIIIQQVTEVAEGDSVINVAGEESKYAAILAAIAELKAEIEAAEAIETEGKQDVDPFLAAIATAKTFLASEDVEAIQQAIADLKAAVEAFNAANAVSENDLNVTWIAAEDETIAAYTSKNTTVTDVVYNIDANTTVTIKQNDEANKAPLYNLGSHTLRAYNGNTVVIKGNKLHKIVISPSNVKEYTAEGLSTEGSKFNAELKQVIWEGEANEVVFTCTKDGENYSEVGKIYVVYEDPEAVGIDEVKSEKAAQQGIFNLQGQRVEKAGKGLYIVNGKKVLF